uniref:Uncharacterized protein n=1 Tax=Anguilla anguilla TaxID=7936 RepID=A0A0E9PEH6_ANGAN
MLDENLLGSVFLCLTKKCGFQKGQFSGKN